jgi:hypothetical protein
MTCSILSAIIASTKVANWARKPGWRIAAKDRLAGDAAPADTGLISFMKNHQFTGIVQGCEGWYPAARGAARERRAKRHENMPELADGAAWACSRAGGTPNVVSRAPRRYAESLSFSLNAVSIRNNY